MGLHMGTQPAWFDIKPWARDWEPRLKTVTVVLFIVGVVSLQTPWFVLLAWCMTVLGAHLMGLRLMFLLRKLVLLFPFLALMTIPLILGGGWPPDTERISFAAILVFKALTSMTAMLVMLTTQPVKEFFNALAHMKVPRVIVTVLFLAYRYAYLFMQELKHTRRSLASRLFTSDMNRRSLRTYGELCGGLIIKSIDLSDNVYKAMVSRCFDGNLPSGEPQTITRWDVGKAMIVMFLVIFLILVERVVI